MAPYSGEDLLTLLAQLALGPDVSVERHGLDPEFAAQVGYLRCRGGPSRPGPAAPVLSTARTSCRPCGHGPARPLSPAIVRSRISSRSNSASAAKMPNTRRPAAVVVSICAPWPARYPQSHAAGRQVLHGVDQMGEVAAEAGELPDDEHVALAQGAQAVGRAPAGRRVRRRRSPLGWEHINLTGEYRWPSAGPRATRKHLT